MSCRRAWFPIYCYRSMINTVSYSKKFKSLFPHPGRLLGKLSGDHPIYILCQSFPWIVKINLSPTQNKNNLRRQPLEQTNCQNWFLQISVNVKTTGASVLLFGTALNDVYWLTMVVLGLKSKKIIVMDEWRRAERKGKVRTRPNIKLYQAPTTLEHDVILLATPQFQSQMAAPMHVYAILRLQWYLQISSHSRR